MSKLLTACTVPSIMPVLLGYGIGQCLIVPLLLWLGSGWQSVAGSAAFALPFTLIVVPLLTRRGAHPH